MIEVGWLEMDNRQEQDTMIKGFGGIFWRTKNLEATKKWYSEVLTTIFQQAINNGKFPST